MSARLAERRDGRGPHWMVPAARVSAYTNARSAKIARTNLRDLCCCCFYVSHSLNTIFK